MASLFKKLINPLEKMAQKEIGSLINKAENALLGAVSDSLGRLGMSSKSKSGILASLGDSILSGIASEFFGGFSGEVNRLAKRDIIKNTGWTSAGGGDANVDGLDNSGVSGNASKIALLQFPADLDKYYVAFEFKEYKRPTPGAPASKIWISSIALPLPRDLLEEHGIAYNTSSLGIVGSVADAFSRGTNTTSGIFGAAGMYAAETLAGGMGSFGDDLKVVLQQSLGMASNPNLSVAFQSPKLRSHKFSWTFAPNNEDESNAIKNIIKEFKKNALPNFTSDTTAVLTYPNMCQIVLYPWGADTEDNYLYVFKTCMIESVSVNYAPDALVFFNNDAPGFVSLTVNLIEIEYFTADTFGKVQTTAAKTAVDKIAENSKEMLDQITKVDPKATGE
jgi:hypothetical protein